MGLGEVETTTFFWSVPPGPPIVLMEPHVTMLAFDIGVDLRRELADLYVDRFGLSRLNDFPPLVLPLLATWSASGSARRLLIEAPVSGAPILDSDLTTIRRDWQQAARREGHIGFVFGVEIGLHKRAARAHQLPLGAVQDACAAGRVVGGLIAYRETG